MNFEEIEHTADRAFRVQGRNLAELLVNAARAMGVLNRLEPGGEPPAMREIELEGIDRETLLVNWLNEILYLEQTVRSTIVSRSWRPATTTSTRDLMVDSQSAALHPSKLPLSMTWQ